MKVLSKVAALALAAGMGAGAHAAFPERPVRLVVPFGAGGITDIVARQVGKGMGDVLGQSIVIENRPGAGGMIAAQVAATAPADGYTIFMGTVGTQVVNPLIYSKLSYDADKFAPVGMVSGSPYVLAVRAGLPAASFSEFVAYAKANPARLNFGSAGNASSPRGFEIGTSGSTAGPVAPSSGSPLRRPSRASPSARGRRTAGRGRRWRFPCSEGCSSPSWSGRSSPFAGGRSPGIGSG